MAVAKREATLALALLARLEQSILARAFRGELVTQDPAIAVAPALAPDARKTTSARRRVA